MQKLSDVKLQRGCVSPEDAAQAPVNAEGGGAEGGGAEGGVSNRPCVQCFCRPMWCLECMGKWFASRQDQQRPDTWLGSKSPCPTCRAVFCILDVCKIATWLLCAQGCLTCHHVMAQCCIRGPDKWLIYLTKPSFMFGCMWQCFCIIN